MGRWEPNARGRLGRAAMELYVERGFDQTTVADIAERAGLTKRTFFRHYADKRDVLFVGTALLTEVVARAVTEAPADLSPVAATTRALEAAAGIVQERPEDVRMRQAVIDAHVELQERELVKLAALATDLAAALQARGVDVWTARLLAETGLAAFRVAFARWIADNAEGPLTRLVTDSMEELAAAVAKP
ncbi:TetR family transcriptional regulator [Streptacidiphilus carbonis]|jgi:AcrR family transcriptional regulator|uniref:TetR family transcriptional regulator n=1 Tax=Streptacidiphilus carbonis TaxID=105422 RepID=UPI0005AB74CF|nr:TetR family transcriptional regulator [Streptacidiphilus carbonis]